tara:strand:+ start:144 stop:476 length:333 start_codon:yes stop_codon:yes gene_type:complete
MKELTNLPDVIVVIISDFLWGNIKSQKEKFDKVLKENRFPTPFFDIRLNLKPTPYCNFSGKLLSIEDESYCNRCGEKTMFPFTLSLCDTCNTNAQHYLSNTTTYPMHQYF